MLPSICNIARRNVFRTLPGAVLLCAGWAQQPGPGTGSNIERCLKGLPSCDVSRLLPGDLARMAESYAHRNLELCRAGAAACDPVSLPKQELLGVLTAARQRNLERCLTGSANCDPTSLGPEESLRVASARRKRN